MKKTFLILTGVYLIISLLFAAFNWDVFTLYLNVSLGFGEINIPLIIDLFSMGLIFILLAWGVVTLSSYKLERDMAKKETEISALKAMKYDEEKEDIEKTKESLAELHEKTDRILNKLGEPASLENEANDTKALAAGEKEEKT